VSGGRGGGKAAAMAVRTRAYEVEWQHWMCDRTGHEAPGPSRCREEDGTKEMFVSIDKAKRGGNGFQSRSGGKAPWNRNVDWSGSNGYRIKCLGFVAR